MKSLKDLFIRTSVSLSPWQVFPFLLVIALLLYGNVMSYPFVHDDYVFIVNNADIGRWDNLSDVFLGPAQAVALDQNNVNTYYRPLLDIVNRFLFLLFGGVPRGYHLANILLHVFNSLWVFGILRSIALSRFMALACSILFLVHPVQSEAVCAIAGISNLLSSFFCFASFFFYLRWKTATAALARNTSAVAVGSFLILALLCKESVVVLPLLVFAYEFLLGVREPGREKQHRFISLSVMLFLPLIIYFGLRHVAVAQLPALGGYAHELGLRLLSIPQTFLMYVRILLIPFDLHYYRSLNILQFSFWPTIILAAGLGCGFVLRKKLEAPQRKFVDFGLCWFLITLAPMMNIVPLINEYAMILTSEHFLYFPLFGFLLVVIVALREVIRKAFGAKSLQAGVVALIFVTLLLSLIAKEQSRYWQGEIPLFQRTLRYQPQFGRIHLLLGRAYYFNGDYLKAIEEYHEALNIMAGYAARTKGTKAYATYQAFIHEIHFELAHCHEELQRPAAAIREYQASLKVRPDDDRVYNNMGINYFFLKDFEKGAACFRKALKLDPRNIMALNNLAFYHIQKGHYARAEGILRKALKLDPFSGSLRQNLKEVVQARVEFQAREKK